MERLFEYYFEPDTQLDDLDEEIKSTESQVLKKSCIAFIIQTPHITLFHYDYVSSNNTRIDARPSSHMMPYPCLIIHGIPLISPP